MPETLKTMCEAFWLSNLRLFSCIQRSNIDKFKAVGCHDHNLNTDRKRRLFKFRKGHSVPKEESRSRFVIVQSNVDQRYDVGLLCLIDLAVYHCSIHSRPKSQPSHCICPFFNLQLSIVTIRLKSLKLSKMYKAVLGIAVHYDRSVQNCTRPGRRRTTTNDHAPLHLVWQRNRLTLHESTHNGFLQIMHPRTFHINNPSDAKLASLSILVKWPVSMATIVKIEKKQKVKYLSIYSTYFHNISF